MQNDNEMVNLRKLNKPSIGQKIRMAGAKMASFFVHQNVTSRDKQGKYATKNGLRDLPKFRWGRIVALVILVAIAGGLYVYKGHAQVYGYDAVAEDQQLYMIQCYTSECWAENTQKK